MFRFAFIIISSHTYPTTYQKLGPMISPFRLPTSFKVLLCKRSAPVHNIGSMFSMFKSAYAWFAPAVCVDNC